MCGSILSSVNISKLNKLLQMIAKQTYGLETFLLLQGN